MTERSSSLAGPIIIAAVITAAVTGLRLFGELQGWSSTYFGSEAGGGRSLVGIVWLVPIFGFWFGWLLRKRSGPLQVGKKALLYLAGIAVFALGMWVSVQAGLVNMPSEESPGKFTGMSFFVGLIGIALLLGLGAWPRLTLALVAYGILARLPVVLVTKLDLDNGWNTHYGELPAFIHVDGPDGLFWGLVAPQLTLWPLLFTTMVGGLFGCLGAKLAGGSRPD